LARGHARLSVAARGKGAASVTRREDRPPRHHGARPRGVVTAFRAASSSRRALYV